MYYNKSLNIPIVCLGHTFCIINCLYYSFVLICYFEKILIFKMFLFFILNFIIIVYVEFKIFLIKYLEI